MFKNLTIKTRLAFVIGLLGLRSLSATNDSLQTVHNDRLVAVGQLDEMLALIQQN